MVLNSWLDNLKEVYPKRKKKLRKDFKSLKWYIWYVWLNQISTFVKEGKHDGCIQSYNQHE